MEPDYQRSASAAADTLRKYGITSPADPMTVLTKLPNVKLIAFASAAIEWNGQDSMTMVNRQDGQLQYIILYNNDLPPSRLRRVLSRELGHVILGHSKETPEFISAEEADCFSFHFICPHTAPVVSIYFRPHHSSISMSFKGMQTYPSMEALKQAIAEERTRYSRFIGRGISYTADDVQIIAQDQDDIFGGWKNFSSVLVDGILVGSCGE